MADHQHHPAATATTEAEARRWFAGYLGRLSTSSGGDAPALAGACFDPDAGPFSAIAAYCALCADPPPHHDAFAAELEHRRYLPALRRALATRGRSVIARLELPAWTSLLVGPLIDTVAERVTLEDVITVLLDALCIQIRQEEWNANLSMRDEAAPETTGADGADGADGVTAVGGAYAYAAGVAGAGGADDGADEDPEAKRQRVDGA